MYYEPFLGGGALFFTRRPARARLSDINPELVNAYGCVRDDVAAVIAHLTQHAARHTPDYYYAVRARRLEDLAPVERAARLIYLNRTCYNGLYRENGRGEFNVPLGRYTNPTICDAANLRAASDALQCAEIRVAPFEGVLDQARPGDVVYFDPPYHPLSPTSNFTGYSRFAFGAAAQTRLRDVFAALRARGVRALLSNSDCAFTRELYRDFRVITITAGRAINTRPERRGKLTEILALNWEE
jgi:DNA adenine methylase